MKANVESLKNATNAIAYLFNTKTTLEAAQNIKIKTAGNTQGWIEAVGISGAATALFTISESNESGEEITIRYHDLVKIISVATAEVIEITQKGIDIFFRSGKGKGKCQAAKSDDVLNWDFESKFDTIFTLEIKEYVERIRFASKFASTDELRPQLNGVSIGITEQEIVMYATDTHSLVRMFLKNFHAVEREHVGKTLFLDTGMADCLSSMSGTASFSLFKNNLVLQDDIITMYFRQPNDLLAYDKVLPIIDNATQERDSTFHIFVTPAIEIVKSISRGMVFVSSKTERYLDFENGQVVFQDMETNKNYSEKFENLSVGENRYRFSANTLLRLGTLKGDIAFKFRDSDNTKPVIVNHTDFEIEMLFMPIVITK